MLSRLPMPPFDETPPDGGRADPTACDPIPLVEGEPCAAIILPPDGRTSANEPSVRGARDSVRHSYEGVSVCLSIQDGSGRVDHAECPVVDLSASGVGLLYDRRVEPGVTGHVSFRTIDQKPVRVACIIKRCRPIHDRLYELGIRFKRRLDRVEQRPQKLRPGRELASGIRPRKFDHSGHRLPQDSGAV